MSLPIVFLLYVLSGALLVYFSMKCADYVDLLDKKTSLSGAFIGGVILAAVTSLPEFVTSISSIYVVKNSELIIGNVLGSNGSVIPLFEKPYLVSRWCITVLFSWVSMRK